MLSLLFRGARSVFAGWRPSFGLAFIAGLLLVGCEQSSQGSALTQTDDESVEVVQTQSSDASSRELPRDLSSVSPDASPDELADNGHTHSAVNNSTTQEASAREETPVMDTQPITILALGDSLTEGFGLPEQDAYPAQLEAALAKAGFAHVEVINAGLAGETTSGLVNRLDWVLSTNPDITILTTGANDAMRGIELSVVAENIRQAIERIQAQGSKVILSGMQIYDNLGETYVREFAEIYPQIAQESGVAFIPFFLQGVSGDPALNQTDRIHPTKAGYGVIVQNNILPVLRPLLDSWQVSPTSHANTHENK